MMERKEETRVVKAALQKAGYRNVSVRHGASHTEDWLDVKVAAPGGYTNDKLVAVVALVQRITGRTGDYDGRINVDVGGE